MSLNKKLLSNITWNIFTQLTNNFFPLLIIPLMLYQLGMELYGQMVVALAMWGIPNLLIQYGFQVTASKKISESLNEPSNISHYIATVYLAKLMLFILGLVGVIIALTYTDLNTYMWLVLYTTPFIIGSLINPTWIYIGLGVFKLQTKLTVISKMISLLLLLFFTLINNDYLLVVMYSSVNFVSSVCLLWGLKKDKYKFILCFNPKAAIKEIKSGSEVFYASALTGSYHHIIPIALESYCGPLYVAVLNLCDAGRRVLYQVTQSIFQVIYQNTNSDEKKLRLDVPNVSLKHAFTIMYILYMLGLLLLFILEPLLLNYLGNIDMFDIDYVYLVALCGLTNMIMNAIGLQVLIPLGFTKYLRNSFVFSVLLCFPLMFILLESLDIRGAIISIILCDILVILCLFYMHKLKRIRCLF